MLAETNSGSVVMSGSGYGNWAQYTVEECLPAKCYTFVIEDAGNDGLCCTYGNGGYSVRLNGLEVASGNEFGSRDENDLQCMIPPTDAPTLSPTEVSVWPSPSDCC